VILVILDSARGILDSSCHIGLGTRQIGLLVPCEPYWTRHEADWTSRACHIGLGTRQIGLVVRAILDSARGILDFSCHIGLGTRQIGLLVRAILDSARGIFDFSCHIGLLASFEFVQILDPNLCSSCYLNLGLQREYIEPRTTTTTLDSGRASAI
jgi:hypothetical protein